MQLVNSNGNAVIRRNIQWPCPALSQVESLAPSARRARLLCQVRSEKSISRRLINVKGKSWKGGSRALLRFAIDVVC